MGPDAGIALSANIVDNTVSNGDPGHLPQILLSAPSFIPDRTEFILGETIINPGERIAVIMEQLEKAGATVACIACNSAHAPVIFDEMLNRVREKGLKIKILHIIDETALFMRMYYPQITTAGILSTTGTWLTRIYDKLKESALETIYIEKKEQEMLHRAIYHPEYGIKATGGEEINDIVLEIIKNAREKLISKGAESIILGCTELPLAIKEKEIEGIPVIDPSVALARAAIRDLAPEKLKPWL